MNRPNPLLDQIREILPIIAQNAAQAEQQRSVPEENVRLLKAVKFTRAFQPKAYGGLELSLPEFADCVAAISGACAGTGWAMSLLATHSHQMAMFSQAAQDEFWADNPEATASSSIAPFGQVSETKGGVLFNGDMRWSSGCDHADWAILGFLRTAEDGSKDYHFGVVPRRDYEIEDDWFTAGIRASGTKTLKIKPDTFIPEHRIQSAKAMMTGQNAGFGLYPQSKIYFAPYRPYFASGFSAVSLGIAERMLTVYKNVTANRVRAYTLAKANTATPALMRLAESTHQVLAARALLERTWQEHREHGEAQRYPSDGTLAFWRTNQAYAVKMCVEAVNRLFEVSGGSAWYEQHEAQRLFRDANMTAAHAYTDYDICKQILGRSLAGLEPDPALA